MTKAAHVSETMKTFGYPRTLIRDYDFWAVLLRPAQPTLGALVLAAKSPALAFSELPEGAHAELARITRDIETVLRAEVGYEKINYLMLMMVDREVHFHVIPRYEGARCFDALVLADAGWPGPPALGEGIALDAAQMRALRNRLIAAWPA